MKKHLLKLKRFAALTAAAALIFNGAAGPASSIRPLSELAPALTLTAYADQAAMVNTDTLNVRSGPGTSYSKVTTLTAGTAVTVTGETAGTDGYTWYSINFGSGSGYARHDFIAVQTVYAQAGADFEGWMSSQGFPESYKNGLRGLHAKYPNWVFTAQRTGLDWNTVIDQESKIGRNLVANSSISSWKSIAPGAFDWAGNYWPGFDGASWVQASRELISYYMDPRNFLTDPYIFQFELQKYDPATQNRDGLQKLVAGTFLAGDAVVPVEGSMIEGGTIIEGSVYGGAGTGTGAVSSGGSAAGPGASYSTSSGSGYTVVGPGASGTSSSSTIGPGNASSGSSAGPVQAGANVVGAGPGVSFTNGGYSESDEAEASVHYNLNGETTVGAAPGEKIASAADDRTGAFGDLSGTLASLTDTFDTLTGTIRAYANWQRDEQNKWVYYEKSTGTFLNDGWHWLDGNKDGIAECYYFFSDGSLAVSTTVEGYAVNEDGKWVDENGNIETKNVGGASQAPPVSAGSTDSTVTANANGPVVDAGSVITSPAGGAAGPGSMPGTADGTGTDAAASTGMGQLKKVPYVDIIMKAAAESGVSPYVLASAIIQEQGKKGTSDLISGNSSTYPGYYNFYNTGAYEHDGMNAVTAGLKYAAESGSGNRPWNTIEKAIIGGAKLYGTNYVNNGQDTFYLKKFNVQGSNKYNHQFMTHVLAAASEGAKVSSAYTNELKNTSLEFKIPVYENMPESTTLPTGDGSPNNKLKGLSVDGYALTPTFNMDTESYSLIVDSPTVNITAAVIDSGASVSGAGNVALNVGSNDINITVTAKNGSQRVYKLSITRRENVSFSADNSAMATPISIGANVPGQGPGGYVSAGAAVGSGTVVSAGSGLSIPNEGAVMSNAAGPGPGMSTAQSGGDAAAGVTAGSDGVIIGAGPQ